jgi:threonine/homoserine/homoserine lactone efflux protein
MKLITILLQGSITGLLLTLSFGAGFFALIQTSITKGLQKGLMIAVGAILSDLFFIAFAVFATSFVNSELPKYSEAIRWIALATFLLLGARTISKSSKVVSGSEQGNRPLYYYITKGFLLNLVNPLVLLTWIGISIYLQSALGYQASDLFLFFAAALVSTFASQAGMCLFSHKIKRYLSEKFLHRMNIIIGILFICIGIGLFWGVSGSDNQIQKAKEILEKVPGS